MATEKALYWLAAFVLAFGVTHDYQSGGLKWAHSYVQCASEVLDRYTGPAKGYLASAEFALGLRRSEPMTVPSSLYVDQDQVEMLMAKAEEGEQRAEIACRRVELRRARIERAQRIIEAKLATRMACARIPRIDLQVQRVQVDVPRISVNVPRIKVGGPRIDIAVPEVPEQPVVEMDEQ